MTQQRAEAKSPGKEAARGISNSFLVAMTRRRHIKMPGSEDDADAWPPEENRK
jgi:hypothetical protein